MSDTVKQTGNGTHADDLNRTRSFYLLLGTLVIAALYQHAGDALADTFDIITRTQLSPDIIEIHIDRPQVKRAVTAYPSIVFNSGDEVTITAGGCVQTGGHGKTWKRYVDPLGSNADELYSAMLNIRGVTTGRQRLQMWVNRPLKVTYPSTLELGYQDDNYSDNGCGGHDDGTGNQCRGIGPAWVRITIKRGTTESSAKFPRYNEVYQKSSHNSYVSSKPPLGIQLQNDHIRSLEIDIHSKHGPGSTEYRGDWYVYHRWGIDMSTNGCNKLSICLDQLRTWHLARPNHEIVTIFIDLQDDWDDGNGQGPSDFDQAVFAHLPGAVYTAAELVKSCLAGGMISNSAREAIHDCGWPSLPSLRNKFIFAMTGDTGQLNRYAGSPQEAVQRVAFIAPEIKSEQEIGRFPNAIFFNLTSDDFTVGRAVFAAGYVSRVYYYNMGLVSGIDDANNWNIAINNSIHHIATDQIDPAANPWTITSNARGWPFSCMLQDCRNMVEPGSHPLEVRRSPPSFPKARPMEK